ncbi:MAG: rod shape-determining protein MreD [Pseudomonadota bacterium]|jgi:rod shape-determining protein MreD
MIHWYYRFLPFLRRFTFFAICNFFDVFILFQGMGLRLQTALIVFYRWVLYTPQRRDLLIFMLFGIFWDGIFHVPFGLHSFLTLVTFIILHTQKRYLQTNHQYIRWLIFLGVLVLSNQIEYALHLLLNQQIAFSFMVILSVFLTGSLYPLIFKFLQHHDQ